MRAVNFHPSQLQWVPVSDRDKDGSTGEIVRLGQLVTESNFGNGTAADRFGTGGVFNCGAAAGVVDTTEEKRITGIVVGTNNQRRVLSTLANFVGIEQITATVAQTTKNASNMSQNGAFWPENNEAMVKIVRLTPDSKVRIRLFNSTRNTAPTVNIVTTGSASGAGFTSDAHDHGTPVANLGTSYFRSGLNKGRMSQTTDTSATVKTFANAFRDDIAVGDKVVTVPLRPFGVSFIQLDAEGDFIDISQDPASNYYAFHVDELHLETPGEEYVVGRFDIAHFGMSRTV